MDVDNIKNLNWCKFTLTALVESVKKWKQNDQAFFEGPLTFLLLCYLDRYVVEGIPQPIRRTIPIISCWDDISLTQRNVGESRVDRSARGRVRELATILEEEDAHLGAKEEAEEKPQEAAQEKPQEEILDSGSSTACNSEEILKSRVDQVFNQIDELYLSGEFKKNNIDPYPIFEARMKIFAETDLYKRFINGMCEGVNKEDQEDKAPLNTPLAPETETVLDAPLAVPLTVLEVLEIVPFTVVEPLLDVVPITVIQNNKGKEVVASGNVERPSKRVIKDLPSVLKSPYVRRGIVVPKSIGDVISIEQQMTDIVFSGGLQHFTRRNYA